MTPEEIDTSQDGRVLTSGDSACNETTSSLTEKLDAAHAKEETESTRFNDDNSESSAGSNAEEGI